MGERIRSYDWSATPLGVPENWPQSLKTSIRIMLMSRQPVWIGWGRDLIYFYNDPYFSIIGGKHPWALGLPIRDVWREIWDVIGPMLATAMSGDEGTYVESQLLIMERNGYPEETYYTFSYSPIPDDEGRPGGIFCANSDDTQRVIGQRELALLRELASRTSKSHTPREACERAMSALQTNSLDIPFAAVYLFGAEGGEAKLEGVSGIEAGHRLAPAKVSLDDAFFGFGQALGEQAAEILTNLGDPADVPAGAWPIPPKTALALPLIASGERYGGGFLLVGLSPYRLLDGAYQGFLSLVAGQIAAAVSDAEAAELERQRLEAMAELDRAKTTFFANVSHEFRTPLTLMLGPIQDLLSEDLGALPPQVLVELDTVRRNGLRLQRLVNALLDFARLEAGRVRAEFRLSDIARFTAELASSFRSAVDQAGLNFIIDCPPLPEHARVYIDRDLWEKLVLNLVSNAFKHTFEGSIGVSIRKEGESVVLTVGDSGIGISEADLAHIFERFRRVEGSRSRTHEGSGIGLALVQEIVRLHGGEVSVRSATDGPDRGTTFTVKLPLGRSHLPPDQVIEDLSPTHVRLAEATVGEALRWLPGEGDDLNNSEKWDDVRPGPPVATAGARVVVVDDNADMRDYMGRLLSRNYVVEAVPDGQAALEAICRQTPDLVVTDLMMPRVDGLELVRAIRSDSGLAHLPIIMVSARAGEEARIEGLDSGADDYLVKPFSARELIARADAALALSRLRREADEELRKSEVRLQLALGAARMVAWSWDTDGEVSTSDNASEILGLPAGSRISSPELLFDLLDPDDLPRHREIFDKAWRVIGGYEDQFRLVRPDNGQTIWLEERARVSERDGKPSGVVGVTMDISERKQAEIRRADAEMLLAEEKRVLELITTGVPLEEVLDRLTRAAERLSRDGMLCSVLRLDESGTRLLHGAAPSLPEAYNTAIDGLVIGPMVGSCGTAAFHREPVTVEDLSEDPRWADYKGLAIAHGLRACSSRPIFSSQAELLGTVAMYYRTPRSPSAHDEEIIDRAARLAGIVMERDRAIAAAEADRNRLRDLFSRAPAIICVLKGPTHVFQLANPLYMSVIGRTNPADVLGKPLRDVLPEIESQGFLGLLDQVYASGEAFFGSEMTVRLDRSGTGELEDVIMNFVYLPSKNADGETDGILVHAVDVTEQVQARRRVEELAQELEARVEHRTAELLHANEQLQGFTYSVAHDLRQQIRGINANASIILSDAADRLDETSRTHLSRLVRSARQLGELVDDLLAHARLGHAVVHVGPVNLSEVASDVIAVLREREDYASRVEFIVRPSPTIQGDASMLRIAVENLLDNACKYSQQVDRPVVEFGHDELGFYVRDNGSGFDMAYAHKLFQPFERLHRDEFFSGTGIGLANVRRIVERHGGQAWANGELGKGATFRFTLS